MVDQLSFAGFIEPEDCAELLPTMRIHQNPGVRHYHELIKQHLNHLETNCEGDAAVRDKPSD